MKTKKRNYMVKLPKIVDGNLKNYKKQHCLRRQKCKIKTISKWLTCELRRKCTKNLNYYN